MIINCKEIREKEKLKIGKVYELWRSEYLKVNT